MAKTRNHCIFGYFTVTVVIIIGRRFYSSVSIKLQWVLPFQTGEWYLAIEKSKDMVGARRTRVLVPQMVPASYEINAVLVWMLFSSSGIYMLMGGLIIIKPK